MGAERRARLSLADTTPQRNTSPVRRSQRQRPCDQPLPDPVWLTVSTDTAAAYWRLIATRSSSSGLIRWSASSASSRSRDRGVETGQHGPNVRAHASLD